MMLPKNFDNSTTLVEMLQLKDRDNGEAITHYDMWERVNQQLGEEFDVKGKVLLHPDLHKLVVDEIVRIPGIDQANPDAPYNATAQRIIEARMERLDGIVGHHGDQLEEWGAAILRLFDVVHDVQCEHEGRKFDPEQFDPVVNATAHQAQYAETELTYYVNHLEGEHMANLIRFTDALYSTEGEHMSLGRWRQVSHLFIDLFTAATFAATDWDDDSASRWAVMDNYERLCTGEKDYPSPFEEPRASYITGESHGPSGLIRALMDAMASGNAVVIVDESLSEDGLEQLLQSEGPLVSPETRAKFKDALSEEQTSNPNFNPFDPSTWSDGDGRPQA